MNGFILVFLGAGVGGSLRHGVNLTCLRLCGPAFPWATLVINVVGSLVMGLAAGWFTAKAGHTWAQPARLFLTTGVLGGFTTFSAFSLDAVSLWERGSTGEAAFYVLASVLGALAGLVAGLALARSLA